MRGRLLSAAIIALLLLPGQCAAASDEESLPHSILIINQSTSFRPWPNAIIAGIRSSLNQNAGTGITLFAENLDLYQFNNPQYETSLQNHFREKYRDKPIGVIVAIGPAALEYTLKLRAAVWPSVAIVFAAVDESTTTKFIFAPNLTGTAIQMSLANLLRAARNLLPDLKRFAIVGDPFERQLYYRGVRDELPEFSRQFQFIDLMGLPIAEVRKRVGALPDHTVIFYIGINSDPDQSYVAAEVLPLIAEAANQPILVDIETFIGSGALGGSVLRPTEIGEDTARLALRILSGESAAAIPIAAGSPPKPIFDGRQLQRWKISEQRLPPGSEVRFHESSMWEQYRGQLLAMVAAILVQTAMIIWLIYEHRRRLSAEVVARNTIADLARINRVATAGALSASIAHEINQPLTGIVARGSAALRWLSGSTPDVDKARAALSQIVDAGYRASEIVKSVRAMFKHQTEGGVPLNINNVILEVLALVRDDLQRHGITVQIRLNEQLPPAIGDRVQLQQVVMNLVMNAIEAMETVNDRRRVLRIRAELSEPGKLLVSVEDSGTGIDPNNVNRIFDPMFTTKARGMGVGLSICRSIIESHRGKLWASPGKNGSIFQFVLPTGAPGQ